MRTWRAPGSRRRRLPRRSLDMRRVVDRETHSSRAAAAGVAAVLVMGLRGLRPPRIGRARHRPAGLADRTPAGCRTHRCTPGGLPPLLLGAGGAVVAMVGLFFLLNAVLPGRRARHVLDGPAISRPWWWMTRSSRRPWPAAPACRQCHSGTGHGGGFPAAGHRECPAHLRSAGERERGARRRRGRTQRDVAGSPAGSPRQHFHRQG